MRSCLAVVGLILVIGGCHRRQAPLPLAPAAHYLVGAAWSGADGAWFYPKEEFGYAGTGLAVVEVAHAPGLTADGELYDPGALAASHQTLQLPAIIRVTNLENGLEMLVRVNDRGPREQGRLLAMTPAAARLLRMQPGAATRIRVESDGPLSRQLAQQLGGGSHLNIQTAPVEGVQEQSLPAPGVQAQAAGDEIMADGRPAAVDEEAPLPDKLPSFPVQGQPEPGSLWIDGGQFNERLYADQVASEIGGSVQTEGQRRETIYIVRAGPFQHISDADAALDQARRAGVTGARIIVE